MLARCETKPQMRPYLVARAGTLGHNWTDDWKRLDQLFRLYAKEHKRSDSDSWPLTEQAALRFRGARPRDAVPLLERSLAAEGRPGRAVLDWLWLALAYQRMGSLLEARRWLARAANWLDQQGGRMPVETCELGSHRHNWLEAHVLRQEAEAQRR
jgi:hypothetical protein